MTRMRVTELLPFLTLAAMIAILSSTVAVSAGFAFPDLSGPFTFGSTFPAYSPGTATTVQKALMPFDDLALQSGIGLPFGGFSLFRSPATSESSYTRTIMTPEGPLTQTVDRTYDGLTGERTTTVTNL